jgi:hypothetical protein
MRCAVSKISGTGRFKLGVAYRSGGELGLEHYAEVGSDPDYAEVD